jgi:hypothetical protein
MSPLSFDYRAVWTCILKVARFCPSPHNVQPWHLEIKGTGADLYVVGNRTFPNTDFTGSFIVSTMMMFLICLEVSAKNQGYIVEWDVVDVEKLDFSRQMSLFARLSLRDDPNPSPHRFSQELLLSRKTSRKPNYLRPVSDPVLEEIREEINSGGFGVKIVSEPTVIDRVLRLDGLALSNDVNDPLYFDELRPLLRLRDNKTGLFYRNMEMPRAQLAALKYMPWLLKLPVLGDLFREGYRRQLGRAQHMAFITGPFWDRADALSAGRMLINMWLVMSKHRVVLHPFGNLVTNTDARAKIESMLGIEGLWFVCRLGFTDEPPTSRRFSVADIANFN